MLIYHVGLKLPTKKKKKKNSQQKNLTISFIFY